jgi:hypothetical protein
VQHAQVQAGNGRKLLMNRINVFKLKTHFAKKGWKK